MTLGRLTSYGSGAKSTHMHIVCLPEDGMESTCWGGMDWNGQNPERIRAHHVSREPKKRKFSEQLSGRGVALPLSSLLSRVNVTVSLVTGCGHAPASASPVKSLIWSSTSAHYIIVIITPPFFSEQFQM